jgi:asparagine synthase (glutamine-hydrolysing)
MDPGGRGNQPLTSENQATAIVANGEIYNFHSLRDQLLSMHSFSTTSDSEVPLHLYEDVGAHTASQLDGMFAFAVTNGLELYVARDPVGIKPLYYGYSDGRMLFASELKALVGLAKDVNEFPPGTFYHSKIGFRKFRSLPKPTPEDRSVEDLCAQIRSTLERAVTKRLMSDVPLGAFLSGGLDSSIIAAVARQHMDELHTFSVGLEGSSDLEAARVVARHLDTVHHEYIFTENEVRAHLPEIIGHLESFDQDLVRSAVPCYFVSRLASNYVKVILTGEGADELFGGYTYYKDIRDQAKLHDELQRSIASLHNINLQRVDRLTMAHSIEGRVPFLDMEVIDLGQRVLPKWKIRHSASDGLIEKWILRKAFEDLLPAEIVWRDKEQFDEGSGTADLLARGLDEVMSERDARRYMAQHEETYLRSREECVYHKLLSEAYEDPSIVLNNVARWADRPGDLAV